jgi:hypothetical protein
MNKTILSALLLTALGPLIFILLLTPDYIGSLGDGFFLGQYLAFATLLLPFCGIIFCIYLFIKNSVSRIFSILLFLLNILALFMIVVISGTISA